MWIDDIIIEATVSAEKYSIYDGEIVFIVILLNIAIVSINVLFD